MPDLKLVSITTASSYPRTRLRPARQQRSLPAFWSLISNQQEGKQYVRNKYAHRLSRPDDWPRRTNSGADTAGNGNTPSDPTPRDRISLGRDSRVSAHRSRPRRVRSAAGCMKAFGVLDLETEMEGCRFSIGLRNSHDKSMRLAMTCGYRVFVCSNIRGLKTIFLNPTTCICIHC